VTSNTIGPTPAATVLIAITALAFFGADIVAAKIATGDWQLVPRGGGADRGTYLVIQITTLTAILIAVWGARRPGGELPGPAWVWVGAGLATAWAGIVIRVWSVLAMAASSAAC
jgi:hypothetical protein